MTEPLGVKVKEIDTHALLFMLNNNFKKRYMSFARDLRDGEVVLDERLPYGQRIVDDSGKTTDYVMLRHPKQLAERLKLFFGLAFDAMQKVKEVTYSLAAQKLFKKKKQSG